MSSQEQQAQMKAAMTAINFAASNPEAVQAVGAAYEQVGTV
jgi:hypothetical protein